ncbi:MAG: hypothetical protein QUS33_09910 [Dehalococcoidia bacterium]|nr:hypothetical protein [Dehalococcoidia bacterium]
MRRTGIFFHYQDGERLRDFPQALSGILDKNNVFLFDAFYPSKTPSDFELEPVSEEVLSRVHTLQMIRQVKATGAFEGALFSAAGTVAAAARIWRREIDNAFVFTGYGDHHAGKNFWGGGCYFNGAAIAIHELRHTFGVRKAAIIDTDAHHGNGTWQIFENDADVLYVCYCPSSFVESKNKVNVEVPWTTDDDHYLDIVRQSLLPRATAFQPECLFWNWGYDGTQGEYGDLGLTPDCHVRLAQLLRLTADELCSGRLIVVLCGGSRRDLARSLIPKIIGVLCDLQT